MILPFSFILFLKYSLIYFLPSGQLLIPVPYIIFNKFTFISTSISKYYHTFLLAFHCHVLYLQDNLNYMKTHQAIITILSHHASLISIVLCRLLHFLMLLLEDLYVLRFSKLIKLMHLLPYTVMIHVLYATC